MKLLKNLNKKQKVVIGSVIGGVLMIAVVAVCVLYKHGVFGRKAPTASEETVQTVTESITESVTESSSESTTESTTEKETKPPAAPVTKAYKPKPAAPAPPKASASSKSVKLNVPLVKQNPKYPTGCEGASATMLLQYYGYNVTIDEMIAAIPREDLYEENGVVYGPSIYEKFVGDPTKTYTDDRPGYGAFSPVITGALNRVIVKKGNRHTAKNITGCTFSALISQLDMKRPVIVWATANMKTPTLVNSWYIKQPDGSAKYFEYPRGTHVMVLSGYDSQYVYITDPYFGNVKYTHSAFNDKWTLLGNQAIVLEEGGIETTTNFTLPSLPSWPTLPTKPTTEKTTNSTTAPPTAITEPSSEISTDPPQSTDTPEESGTYAEENKSD